MSGAKKRAGTGGGSAVTAAAAASDASEVEEMLQAAHDELLIGLRVGSHTVSSSSLDADLTRRFEALKAPRLAAHSKLNQTATPCRPSLISAPPTEQGERGQQTTGDALEDDLMERFSALKGSIGADSRSPSVIAPDPILKRDEYGDDEETEEVDVVSKKEVDKLIQWAMDAARLDPSRSDDDDGDNDKGSDEGEEDDDELESEGERRAKQDRIRGKGKNPGKWFSLFR